MSESPINAAIDATVACMKCGTPGVGNRDCWAERFGLYDTVDGGWLGDDEGPVSWTDRDLATAAHTVHSIRFGFHGSRLEVRSLGHGSFTRTGDFPAPVMGCLDAIRVAEGEAPRRKRKA